MQVPPPCEFEADKLLIKLDEVVPSEIEVIDGVVSKIVSLIEDRHCWNDVDNVDLALREALANAIIHGSKRDRTKRVRVCVALTDNCSALIVVKDAGSGFDPKDLPNPVVGQNLLSSHGRGIFLINRLMDDVQFTFERGTAIYMRRSAAHREQGAADQPAGQKHENREEK
jgi:serine/threonine-protein kinase RsbW